MPIYEYLCDACGHQLEKLQKMSDVLLVDCPACQQAALRKQISVVGLRRKGSGGYATDNKPNKVKLRSGEQSTQCPVAGQCGSHCTGMASAK